MPKQVNHRKIKLSFVLVFFLLLNSVAFAGITDRILSLTNNGNKITVTYTNAKIERLEVKHTGGNEFSVDLRLNFKRKGDSGFEAYRRFASGLSTVLAVMDKKNQGGLIEDSYSITVNGVRIQIKYKDDSSYRLIVSSEKDFVTVISIRDPRAKETVINEFANTLGLAVGMMRMMITNHATIDKNQKETLTFLFTDFGVAESILDKLQWKAAGGRFNYRNLRCKKSFLGTSCFGEIDNYSRKSYQVVTFDLSAYDENGSLLDVTKIIMTSFGNDTVKTFKTSLDVDATAVSKYKIRFDSGM